MSEQAVTQELLESLDPDCGDCRFWGMSLLYATMPALSGGYRRAALRHLRNRHPEFESETPSD